MSEVTGKNRAKPCITDLGFRTQAVLERCGIHTTDDLLRMSDTDLLRLPGLGRRTLNEIREMTHPRDEPAPAAPKPAPAPEPVVTMALETFVQTFISPKFERLHYALDALAIEIRGERAAFFAGVDKITAAGAAKKKRKKAPKKDAPQ